MKNSTISKHFHSALAESILSTIRNNTSRYYYFFGKTTQFNDQNQIEEPNDSFIYELGVRNDMIMLKHLTSNDVAFVINRINWTDGTVYDHYDDSYSVDNPAYSGATSIESAKFYVLHENNVYKCLDNNNNSPSTVPPTGTDSNSFTNIGDGYKWKFIYSVPLNLKNKFLTNIYLPVTKAISNRYYNNGGLDNFTIKNTGSNYSENTYIAVTSDSGTGAILQPVINESGEIVDVIIVNHGEGYLDAVITVHDSIGSGANIVCSTDYGLINSNQANVELNATNGAIEFIKVIDQGFNYFSPIVTVSGDGTGCIARAIVGSDNKISNIEILNPGVDYTYATVDITDASGYGCSARVIISPPGGHGSNAITELFASKLMFSVNIKNTEVHGMIIDNDFRQYGLIRQVLDSFNSITQGDNLTTCYSVTGYNTVDISKFTQDTILYRTVEGNTYDFLIVHSELNNAQTGIKLLLQPLNNGFLQGGETLISLNNDVFIIDTESLIVPTANKSSGEMLYIDNRNAFYQSDEQAVTVQTVIKF